MPPLDHSILEILAPLINSSAGDVWAKLAARAGNGGIQALAVALLLLAGRRLGRRPSRKPVRRAVLFGSTQVFLLKSTGMPE